ncbi:MAG: nuclease [Alphaproteobacteria bacterium]|nr:nuclease [Alphaproteobacteria bacterium]
MIALMIAATVASCSLPPAHSTFAGTVYKIVDGDTLRMDLDAGGCTVVRLGDFDAPERGQQGGGIATRALKALVLGKHVVCTGCEGARDPKRCYSHERIVATCRLNGERLGDLMRGKGVPEGGR